MKKFIILSIIVILVILTGCQEVVDTNKEKTPTPTIEEDIYTYSTKTNLHYILPTIEDSSDCYLGDVHPYYDEERKMLYLYYLDTSGRFQTKLITSFDGIKFIPNSKFNVKNAIVPYSVLNVTKKGKEYYSYFADFQCSKSTDLVNWEYMGKTYKIPLNTSKYNSGMRDPSVVYDENDSCFYAIGLAYKTINNNKVSNLIITKSTGNDNLSWESSFKEVLSANQINKDYECPMLIKINNRWYVFSSQYGNSVHGVGRTSYWIGDEGVSPYEVNWKKKQEHFLTGEDLCAAQIFSMNNKFYMFGWIPQKYNGSNWGGSLNLLREVYSGEDGLLYTRIDEFLSSKLKKKKIYEEKDLTINETMGVDFSNDHYILETSFNLIEKNVSFSFQNSEYSVVLDKENQELIIKNNDYICSQISVTGLDSLCNFKIIADGNCIEVVLNDQYVLSARINKQLSLDEHLVINSLNCNISKLALYRLAYLEEL